MKRDCRVLAVLLFAIVLAGCESMSQRLGASHERSLAESLRSSSIDVRLAALDELQVSVKTDLPEEVLVLVRDSDPRLRRAALMTLATREHPKALELVTTALDDPDFSVRHAAIGALGELGGAEAEHFLEQALKDPSETLRAASVASLAKLKRFESVAGAAQDKQWRVRLAVATALAEYEQSSQAVELALALAADRQADVQRQVVTAMQAWPLEDAAAVLLVLAESSSYLASKAATEQLAQRWPPARVLPTEPPRTTDAKQLAYWKDERAKQIASLRDRAKYELRPSHGAADESKQSAADPPRPIASGDLEPRIAAAIGALADRNRDISVRRRAAADLAALAKDRLPEAALAALAERALAESDPIIWQSVLAAASHSNSPSAVRLASIAIGHSSPEVRRRACDFLGRLGDRRHLGVLIPALSDPAPSVAAAAARAAGECGPLDDPAPLVNLLARGDIQVRLEAAESLVRQGHVQGRDALERLAYDRDVKVRRQAALAMGRTGDTSFVPTLVNLLDDRTSVQQAALESLSKLEGKLPEPRPAATLAGGPASAPSDVERWKAWHQQR